MLCLLPPIAPHPHWEKTNRKTTKHLISPHGKNNIYIYTIWCIPLYMIHIRIPPHTATSKPACHRGAAGLRSSPAFDRCHRAGGNRRLPPHAPWTVWPACGSAWIGVKVGIKIHPADRSMRYIYKHVSGLAGLGEHVFITAIGLNQRMFWLK